MRRAATSTATDPPESFRRGEGSRLAVLLGLVAFAYLYVFPYHPRVNNPNENVRFFTTAALVDEGTYHIDAIRERWGWVNDAAVYEGHYCSVKAPATSVLGVPAYALVRALQGPNLDRNTALWACRISASVLPSLLFAWAYARWLTRRGGPPALRDAVVLSVLIGSMFYAYSLLFVTHALSAVAAFGAFMLLRDARHGRSISTPAAFGAGFLATLVTATEYPGFPATLVLCLYALTALRPYVRAVPFAAGAALPTAVVLHFHQACYGSPFRPGHRYLENDDFRDAMHEGFYGAATFHWDAAGGMLFDPAYGLFLVTPIFFFAFLGVPALLAQRRQRLDTVAALLVCGTTYVLICMMNNWRGGWTVGARYLALVVPFVGWFALEGARVVVLWTRAPRAVSAVGIGTLAVGVLLSGGPSVYYPHLPEAFTRPLPQLIRWLARHDYAPYNAGRALFGWTGTASLAPLFIVGVILVFWPVLRERRWTDRVLVATAALFVASWIITPFIGLDVPNEAAAADARRFVTEYWDPPGEDLASRIEARVREGRATPAERSRLPGIYLDEGRRDAAEVARRSLRQEPAGP